LQPFSKNKHPTFSQNTSNQKTKDCIHFRIRQNQHQNKKSVSNLILIQTLQSEFRQLQPKHSILSITLIYQFTPITPPRRGGQPRPKGAEEVRSTDIILIPTRVLLGYLHIQNYHIMTFTDLYHKLLSFFLRNPDDYTKDFSSLIHKINPILDKLKGTKLFYMIRRYQTEKKVIYV